jgi:cytochrome P450
VVAEEVRAVGPVPELEAAFLSLVLDPATKQDPYPLYARLHREAPLYRSANGGLVLAAYDLCHSLLRDDAWGKEAGDEVGSSPLRAAGLREEPNALPGRLAFLSQLGLTEQELRRAKERFERRTTLLFLDPPDHTRLRRLVSKAFTPKRVEAMRDHVAKLLDELMDPLEGEVDLMEAVAWRLPSLVICELLGVPPADREWLRPLVRSGARLLEPVFTREDFLEALSAQQEVEAYFRDLAEEKRRRPDQGLVSALVEVRDGSDALTEDELISTCGLIFGAGFETTTNLIGNGTLALLRNPDQFEKLRNDPSLTPLAVEELLRYDSPVQIDGRVALRDTEFCGEPVTKGTFAITLLGAANRDPRRFSDPERLLIDRQEGSHLAFATGIHYCLGAALARLEGQVYFEHLATKVRSIELLEQPRYRDSITLRGLERLRVRLARS